MIFLVIFLGILNVLQLLALRWLLKELEFSIGQCQKIQNDYLEHLIKEDERIMIERYRTEQKT